MIVLSFLFFISMHNQIIRKVASFNLPSVSKSPLRSYQLHSSNPFSSLLGDMAKSFRIGSNHAPLNQQIDTKLQSVIDSWHDIRNTLQNQQTLEERRFRDNLLKGYGRGSPLHKVRLFDESNKEEDIRVTFYRDSASWCPYCQKVWLTLEEKRIPYRVEKINMSCYGDKPSSFLQIQPGGQIPVANIDGRIYGQSNDIIFALEDEFPDNKSLRPLDGRLAQQLLRLERGIFSAWMSWLTGSARNRAYFLNTLQEVEDALVASNGSFFMGSKVSMVDIQFAPFLERMAASLLYFKGFMLRVPKGVPTKYPAINSWFDAMEELESYQLTKSDYYTHCWDLPPQLGGCTSEPDGEPYRKAINGDRRLDGSCGSWTLPLECHNGGVEPDWDWATDASHREAAERISGNAEAIVAFACRGAGQKGFSSYRAPLADPKAVPNPAVSQGVEACLQVICKALLDGTESHISSMAAVVKVIREDGGADYAVGVANSLSYLRDRVGVPRDMRLPAARALRAHLNWAIDSIMNQA
jgi:glutathione S-transferase